MAANSDRSGPLAGLKVVEFTGQGPVPFCAMLLADLGADIVRIDRPGGNYMGGPEIPHEKDLLARGRRSVAVNLKDPEGVETCLALIERADILLEGYRPGVMERLGLGPEAAFARNPRLVYGRMTGFGQTGPYAPLAGHDLNYISLSGAAMAVGTPEQPLPPLNLVGDFGGGALYLAFGVLAAHRHAQLSGEGQVVDCAMTDGAASLMTCIYMLDALGEWSHRRGENLLDGGAHFYGMYRCADDRFVSVAAIENKFYQLLLDKTGLEDPGHAAHADRKRWPEMRDRLAAIFRTKSRAEWCEIMEGCDACFSPVQDLAEAPQHPHNVARETFVEIGGVIQPAPAPKFSATPGRIQSPPPRVGEHSRTALADWGVDPAVIAERLERGVITDR